MSSRGSCIHVQSGTYHTWSIGAISHCVKCIHAKYSDVPSIGIQLGYLDSIEDLTYYWDEDIDGNMSRVDAADLSYPIFITRAHGKFMIVDGCHRTVKAKLMGLETIDAIILTNDELATCRTH